MEETEPHAPSKRMSQAVITALLVQDIYALPTKFHFIFIFATVLNSHL